MKKKPNTKSREYSLKKDAVTSAKRYGLRWGGEGVQLLGMGAGIRGGMNLLMRNKPLRSLATLAGGAAVYGVGSAMTRAGLRTKSPYLPKQVGTKKRKTKKR